MVRQRCRALIVYAKALSDAELVTLMQQIPGRVLMNRIVPGFAHHGVCRDNVKGALRATRMLLQHGHRQIGYPWLFRSD